VPHCSSCRWEAASGCADHWDRDTDLPARHLLLAGGGYGVAPLLFLAREAVAAGCEVRSVSARRTAADVLLVEDFEKLGAAVHITTEDGSLGNSRVGDRDRRGRHPKPAARYGICLRPVRMLVAIDRLCETQGLPAAVVGGSHAL